jgi:Na+/melibiose symporter-like transporter
MAYFVYMVVFGSTPEYSNGLLNESRYSLMAVAGAFLVVGAVLLCTLGTADQIPYLHQVRKERIEYKAYFKELLQLIVNPSYAAVCGSWLTVSIGLSILGMVGTYTYVYAFELSTEAMAIAALTKFPGIVVALPLATLMTRWIDKKGTVIAISLFSACVIGSPYVLKMIGWFPANDSPWLLLAIFGPLFLGYMIFPVVPIVVDSQLVDIADDHEYRTGKRSEGIVFSVRTFAMKATGGLGGMVGGFALEFIGFPQDAEVGQLAEETVNGLLFISGPLYIATSGLGMLFMFMYRLNEKRHQEILTVLEERRGVRSPD